MLKVLIVTAQVQAREVPLAVVLEMQMAILVATVPLIA